MSTRNATARGRTAAVREVSDNLEIRQVLGILCVRDPFDADLAATPLQSREVVEALCAALNNVPHASDYGSACIRAAQWLGGCVVHVLVAVPPTGVVEWRRLEPEAVGYDKEAARGCPCPAFVGGTDRHGRAWRAPIAAVGAVRFKLTFASSTSPSSFIPGAAPMIRLNGARASRAEPLAVVPYVPPETRGHGLPVAHAVVAVAPVPTVPVASHATGSATASATADSATSGEDEATVVHAVRVTSGHSGGGSHGRSTGRSRGAAARSGDARAGGQAGPDIATQMANLARSVAFQKCTRAVVRTHVLAKLLDQLFTQGTFAEDTSLRRVQKLYLAQRERLDQDCAPGQALVLDVCSQFCGIFAEAVGSEPNPDGCVCVLAPRLHELSTAGAPSQDGGRVHACALAGTLLNVLQDLPVSGRRGVEPTIVDMIMLHAGLRLDEHDHVSGQLHLNFALQTACVHRAPGDVGPVPVPMALPVWFYEPLDTAQLVGCDDVEDDRASQQDEGRSWCMVAYEQVLEEGRWCMRQVCVQGSAWGCRTVHVRSLSPNTNSGPATGSAVRVVRASSLVRSTRTKFASVSVEEATLCATDAVLQNYYAGNKGLVCARFLCKHVLVPGFRCWARVTTVKEAGAHVVGTLPEEPFGGSEPRYGMATKTEHHGRRHTDHTTVRVTYHEPRSKDSRLVVHWCPCVVLQRTNLDPDVPTLGISPNMGNVKEKFSVLVLVPLDERGGAVEPQQFFAGVAHDVGCVQGKRVLKKSRGRSAVQAWKELPGTVAARSKRKRNRGHVRQPGAREEDGRAPKERMCLEELAKPPEYNMCATQPRGVWSAKHRRLARSNEAGDYFPHTETATTNKRALLGETLDPGVLFAYYFAEHEDLQPDAFRVVQLDISHRDLLAPATRAAQARACQTHARLPLCAVRLGGGQKSAKGPDYFMFSHVRDVLRRGLTDNPMPHCLEDCEPVREPVRGVRDGDDHYVDQDRAPPRARGRHDDGPALPDHLQLAQAPGALGWPDHLQLAQGPRAAVAGVGVRPNEFAAGTDELFRQLLGNGDATASAPNLDLPESAPHDSDLWAGLGNSEDEQEEDDDAADNTALARSLRDAP